MVRNNYIFEKQKQNEGEGEENEVFRLLHRLYEVRDMFFLIKNLCRISFSNTYALIFISQKAELKLGFNVTL